MPNLNIMLDASLLRAINHKALDAGVTQRDWVIQVLAFNAGWQQPIAPLPVIERSAEFVSPAANDCPECGADMKHNKLMRRFECECGYQGKPSKA